MQDGERTVTLRRVGNEQYLAMMFHTVRGAHPDYIATDALGELMTVAPAGRLYKSLVETKKAASVEVWQEAQKDPGIHHLLRPDSGGRGDRAGARGDVRDRSKT